MPVCFNCKTESVDAFQPVQSKILLDIIDRIKVGHRCSRFKDLQMMTVAQLKNHVQSGECPGYLFKCFCNSQDRFTYDEIKKHLREDCDSVRLQCKYCQKDHEYPNGPLDSQQLIHFKNNSYSRAEFKEHTCYTEQKMIDGNLRNDETISKIKMLLLQKSQLMQDQQKKCQMS